MSTVEELRKIELDHDLINEVHAHYQDWQETGSPKTYQQIGTKSIPLVNVLLSNAIRKHKITGGPEVFDELYSFAYMTYLETINKNKKYDTPNEFYSYMKLRVGFSIFDHFMDEIVGDDQTISSEELEFHQFPILEGIDVSNVSNNLFQSYAKYFLSPYDEKTKEAFMFFVSYYQSNREEATPALIETKFDIPEWKSLEIVERGRILYRTILFFCLTENREPHKYISKEDRQIMVSKYFLVLLSMEKKYPHLTELFALLGDQTHDVIKVLGGEKLKLPTVEELKEVDLEVQVVMDFIKDPRKDALDSICTKNNITRRELNNILRVFKNRYEHVPFLGEKLQKVDEVYAQ